MAPVASTVLVLREVDGLTRFDDEVSDDVRRSATVDSSCRRPVRSRQRLVRRRRFVPNIIDGCTTGRNPSALTFVSGAAVAGITAWVKRADGGGGGVAQAGNVSVALTWVKYDGERLISLSGIFLLSSERLAFVMAMLLIDVPS